MTPKRSAICILLAFTLSIVVRLPVMDRPLSKHHEFNAAMALNVCNSWQLRGGPAAEYFTPLIHYGNSGDNYTAPHVHVKDSAVHYLSFGPGQFLLPYYTGAVTGAAYTPLLLQVIGLVLHLVSAWLLWLIVLQAFPAHPQRQAAALLAALAFICMPATLWFFCNGYVHEAVVLPLVLALAYFYLRWLPARRPVLLWAMAAAAFAGVYTDWLMIFACMAVGLHSIILYTRRKQAVYLYPVWVLAATVAAALASLFFLYSRGFGTQALVAYFKDASASRQMSSGGNEFSAGNMLYLVLQHLATGYALLLPLLAGIFYWWRKRRGCWQRLQQPAGLLACLFGCTVLYFCIFFQFSAEHDYSVLKFSYLLAIAAAFCCLAIWQRPLLRNILFTIVLLGNVFVFYWINRPGATARNGDRYDKAFAWGQQIQQHTQPDEFLTMESNRENRTALLYYARRNIYQFATPADRDAYFNQSPQTKMCVISIQGDSLVFERRSK